MQTGILTSSIDFASIPRLAAMTQACGYSTRRREVRELTEADRQQVRQLLAEDLLRGIHLLGMVDDCGICHPAHRGRFYGYFEDDQLRNVAVLGHHILIYSESGLAHLAAKAHEIAASANLLLGPTAQMEHFWSYLATYGRQTRLLSPQYWMICREARLPLRQSRLQPSRAEHLDEILATQAELIREQCGIDPRDRDGDGFRQRVEERIERGRTLVQLRDEKIIFKAELISDSASAVYLESIWTHPDYRGRGMATTGVAELAHRFLSQGKSLAILVEPEEVAARHLYERIGFICEEDYQARFLKPLACC